MNRPLDTFAEYLRGRDMDEMTVRTPGWESSHPPGTGEADPPHDPDDEAMAAGDWDGKVEESDLPKVVSLCDTTGTMVKPWLDSGKYECWLVDLENGSGYRRESKNLVVYGGDVRTFRMPANVFMAFAFPPCTDLTKAGSTSWERKDRAAAEAGKRLPVFAATDLVIECWDRIRRAERYMLENPPGRLPTQFRQWNVAFDPFEYGGYLPEDDDAKVTLPSGREYCMVPRDRYTKKTCLWVGGKFVMPDPAPVDQPTERSPAFMKFGGKGSDTKYIRSMTPRGFAIAVFMANDAAPQRRRARKPAVYRGAGIAPRKPSLIGKERQAAGKNYES